MKSQTIAALLTIFLGGFGIHRFYLGKTVSGVLNLLFFWTGIPGLIAFFESLITVFTSPEKWAQKYNNGQMGEPVHIALKAFVIFFLLVVPIGIIAAVALPAYQAYKAKSEAVRAAPSPMRPPMAPKSAPAPAPAPAVLAPAAPAPAPAAPAPAVAAPSPPMVASPPAAAKADDSKSRARVVEAVRSRQAMEPKQEDKRPKLGSQSSCVYKPVMTDEDIARCR